MQSTDPYYERRQQLFPKLDAAQIARIAAFGSKRKVARGEILFDTGDVRTHFFVIVNGTLEVLNFDRGVEKSITISELPAAPWVRPIFACR